MPQLSRKRQRAGAAQGGQVLIGAALPAHLSYLSLECQHSFRKSQQSNTIHVDYTTRTPVMPDIDEDLIALANDERPFRPQVEDVGHTTYVRRMKRLGTEWREFCLHVGQPAPVDGSLFDSPPHLNKVKSFLTWQCRYKKGRLGPRLVLQTVKKLWTEFRLLVHRHTGHRYTQKEIADMTKMLELPFVTYLLTSGLTTNTTTRIPA
ncbi:hypothetical protein Tdes44962_MAKER02381 [Teratosphaeria destructans]|uniref:Uncharacterized protein n=1 Tax=Teratosphaeria destructans TaxID=418781 RepID=A0A9W7SUA3_9PEZI|nr:hypothetical protein Tdes44962_MAKER02381 [Teratosphaeria destructans]